ncbi:MAG: DUF2029 domain-containing protein [Acidobacteriota bacterium]|nr:DUF2029 domain-containing protein [Acidobacteriota bacterium]
MFLVRGPLRSSAGYANDFASPYVASRLWLQQQNAYDSTRFLSTWQAAGAPSGDVYANPSSYHCIYPPTTIAILAPLATLSWPVAWAGMQVLSCLLYGIAALRLAKLTQQGTGSRQVVGLIVFALIFAPVHSGLHVSNIVVLTAALLLWSSSELLLSPATTSLMPALGLGLALSLKPSLVPLVLLWLLATRRWRPLLVAAALPLAAFGVFLLRQSGQPWLHSLLTNQHFLFGYGSGSISATNLTRYDRIDLQLPIYILTQQRQLAVGLAYLAAAALVVLVLATWLRAQPLHRTLDNDLLLLSCLLAIGLIPYYQRYYSACILLLPAVWVVRNHTCIRARVLLACSPLFLLNTSIISRVISDAPTPHPYLLGRLSDTLLNAHVCWLILLIACTLTWQLRDSLRAARA